MAGAGEPAAFDKKTSRLLKEVDQLQPDVKDKFFYLANAIIRDAKAKAAYSG